VPHRILGHKFQHCGIAEVVSTFKRDVPACEIRVPLEMRSQTFHIAGIEESSDEEIEKAKVEVLDRAG